MTEPAVTTKKPDIMTEPAATTKPTTALVTTVTPETGSLSVTTQGPGTTGIAYV